MRHISRRNALRLLTGLAALPALLVSARSARADGHVHEVTIQGFAFQPASLQIAAGDTVRFTNADGAPHTATAADGSFDTGRLGGGDSAEISITSAGSFDYICRFHPNMTGNITAS